MVGSTLRKRKKRIFPQLIGRLVLLSACLSLISCQSQSASVSEPIASPKTQSTKVIVIGDVSNNPAKKITRYQPLADYLANNLSEFGIGRGEVKVAPSLNTMVDWLKSGQVDVYFDSPYPAMIVSDRSDSKPLLRRWKGGQAEYYGVFLTMNDSGIKTLKDLQGQTVAFDDSYSTSGYFLPLVKLVESGLQTIETKSDHASVPADRIGYIFTGDDQNIIQWMISGKVGAGVVDIETFSDIPPESRKEIILLAKTKTVPRQIVSVRQDLDPELREKIKTILINMERTKAGKEVLNKFEKTAKFDNFPAEQSIEELRKLYELITEK